MVSKKKIIFINQVAGYLFIDIINSFADEYDCTLYTGSIDNANVLPDKNVRVRKFIRYNRNIAVKRVFTWSVFTLQVFFRLLFTKKTVELFIVSNPPFVPFIGYLFKKLKGTKYHLLIYDLYPDVLVKFGMISKNGFINKYWSNFNKKLFSNAEMVFTLSDNMSTMIKEYQRIPVEVISNWAHTTFIKPVKKEENAFAHEHNQVDKITVMYSGNMGATHAIEKVAELALHFKPNNDFGFIAIGDGHKKVSITEMKKEYNLDNLLILPYQPADILPLSLTCADIGIVTLSSGAEDLSVPSKTYNLLAAGVALLVIASAQSELARLINQYECGVQFEENNIEGMILFLEKIKGDSAYLQQLKNNSRKASSHFTPANAKLYKKHINNKSHVPQSAETII